MRKIFLSYSHDSEDHKQRVHALAAKLRANPNLQVILDQDMLPAGPNEGWDHWSESQVRDADHVLIVCTERYCARYEGSDSSGAGLGSIAEARLIHRLLYNKGGVNQRFRVVMLTPDDAAHVPDTLQTYHRFAVYQPSGLADLIAWVSGVSNAPQPASPQRVTWPAPIPHVWDMANRQEITTALELLVTGRSAKPIVLLSAASNSGKSHLLGELKSYAQRLAIANACIDCGGSLELATLTGLIADDLDPLLGSPANPVALISALKSLTQPVLLTFDTYEQASAVSKNWLEAQLLPRLDACPAVVTVVAGQLIPKYPAALGDHFTLEPITKPADWLEYCRRKYHPNVQLTHLEALTLATRGIPGVLSPFLETMMSGLRTGAGA